MPHTRSSGSGFAGGCVGLCVALCVVLAATDCPAAVFVDGAWYRLGDDDPGATHWALGNVLTRDSLGEDESLTKYGMPRYTTDLPPRGPADNKLSMVFANEEQFLAEGFPAAYGRSQSLPMSYSGYALEAWVKAAPSVPFRLARRNGLVAYNGDPENDNGFGFFQRAEEYVFRAGNFERVLGRAADGQWHHLAYVQSLGTSSYYYDGQLVAETTDNRIPAPASGGFHLGGLLKGQLIDIPPFPFDGWIDEVRYQAFNPLAAGNFHPAASFLIGTAVPEPAAAPLLACAASIALRRRRRR